MSRTSPHPWERPRVRGVWKGGDGAGGGEGGRGTRTVSLRPEAVPAGMTVETVQLFRPRRETGRYTCLASQKDPSSRPSRASHPVQPDPDGPDPYVPHPPPVCGGTCVRRGCVRTTGRDPSHREYDGGGWGERRHRRPLRTRSGGRRTVPIHGVRVSTGGSDPHLGFTLLFPRGTISWRGHLTPGQWGSPGRTQWGRIRWTDSHRHRTQTETSRRADRVRGLRTRGITGRRRTGDTRVGPR